MSREAMKLALEALELAQDNLRDHGDNCFLHDEGEYNRCFCGKDSLSNHLQSVVEKLDEALNAPLAEQPAQQEPVALFKWLPEGATHIGRISVRTAAGGSLAMTTYAFKYDSEVLKVYVTDNDNEYPGWRDAKDCFFHLNFPVLPLYTSPPAQRPWVGLTHEEAEEVWKRVEASDFRDVVQPFARAIEAALRSRNENNN